MANKPYPIGTEFFLYFYTLRYLRPVQFYGRLRFRLYRPRLKTLPSPSLRPRTGTWQSPARRPPSQYAPTGFRFLNQAHELKSPDDWNHPNRDKLWLYHLHYFDDLNAQDAPAREDRHRALIDRWISENLPVQGYGWESYPLSLRIVNWIKWALAGHVLEDAWRHSLAIQARYLSRRLEHHLLGNHLFANAKALVFAGLFFRGREAEGWLKTGLGILQREVPEQILADGGHFERSPLYHGIILEDLLDLLNLARVYPEQVSVSQLTQWQDSVTRMVDWLRTLCHPDGEIALFNDAAFRIAPRPAKLFAYAERQKIPPRLPFSKIRLAHSLPPLKKGGWGGFREEAQVIKENPPSPPFAKGGERSIASTSSRICQPDLSKGGKWLRDSGYIRLQQGPAVALLDVGEIGPDYLPGHAHADTLSFEFSLFGQRVLVNSGTSCYGTSAERLRQRSTAAHNTVVIDGENSSEVWGGFRVARRARPFALDMVEENDSTWVRCAHDGYRRLPGKPIHWRQWALDSSRLTVSDRIEGDFQEGFARFHFHPTVKLYRDLSGQRGIIRLSDGNTLHWEVQQGRAQLKTTTYHPEFGVSQTNRCLEVKLIDRKSLVSFSW